MTEIRPITIAEQARLAASRDNKLAKDFRDLIEERGGEIEALPDGSFKDSGTGVRTVIVTIPGEGA